MINNRIPFLIVVFMIVCRNMHLFSHLTKSWGWVYCAEKFQPYLKSFQILRQRNKTIIVEFTDFLSVSNYTPALNIQIKLNKQLTLQIVSTQSTSFFLQHEKSLLLMQRPSQNLFLRPKHEPAINLRCV